MNKYEFQTAPFFATSGIKDAIGASDDFNKEVADACERFLNCDWGELDEEDVIVNTHSLAANSSLMGAYSTSSGTIWILYSGTDNTILFPEEY